MMRQVSRVLMVGALLTTLLGCDSITDPGSSERLRISGSVTDGQGRPVPGASLVLEATPFSTQTPTVVGTALTNSAGDYSMTVGPAPGYASINCHILRLYVTAEGYRGASTWRLGDLNDPDCRGGAHKRVNFVLEQDRERRSLHVLVIVGEISDEQDQFLMEMVEWNEHEHHVSQLTVEHATQDRDFQEIDVILVAPSAGELPPDFREVPVGMLVFQATGWERFGMAEDVSQVPGATEILVTEAQHPILKWAGLGEATHGISNSSSGVLWTAGDVGPGAQVLAWSPAGDAAALFAYEAGAELVDGAPARERRVAFAYTPPDLLFFSAELLLVTALEWAAGVSLPGPEPLSRILAP
jgi:hypothetical protein